MAYVIDRPQLESRMMNLGFSYVCTAPPESPGLPSMQSQPAYDSNSLPRRNARGRHVLDRAPSADLANARRKLVSSAVQDYLKSLNAMTRSIVMERETLEEDHGQHWSGLNVTKREEIMNEHFVPSGVRARYQADARPRYPHRNRPHSAGRTLRVPQGDGMHLSQPSVWEDYEAENDLVMKNKAASWSNEDSLSQPSPHSYEWQHHQPSQQEDSQPKTEYRLHKRQPSLRSNHIVRPVIRPHPLPHPNSFSPPSHLPQSRVLPSARDHLGSDGESPRTSDEDSSISGGYVNPLGFNRSKLRSYSMRQKRGSLRNNYQQHARCSTRLPHRIQRPEPARPSHLTPHRNSPVYGPDVAYDDEVDLPVESLLLDHVQGQSDSSSVSSTPKPTRYSKTRRSLRTKPQIVIHDLTADDDTVFSNRHASTNEPLPEPATPSDISLPVFSISDETEIVPNRLLHSPSHDSLDIDSISIAPSNLSELEYSRAMTPDSLLSGSTCSYRPKPKHAEVAIMRNPRGKRGGSSYKSTTSEFADRHAQFKPNMLRKQRFDSCQNSPASSTPVPPEDGLSQTSSLLKPHQGLLLSPVKHRSVAESELPFSPDHLSLLSSPPSTPHRITSLSQDLRRESGYMSTGSSYESFPARR